MTPPTSRQIYAQATIQTDLLSLPQQSLYLFGGVMTPPYDSKIVN